MIRKATSTDLTPAQNERVRIAIRSYMDEQDMTATAMASQLGLSNASLSNILNRKNGAGARTAMRLAQLLGMPYETFISLETPEASAPVASEPIDARTAGFRRFCEFVEDEWPADVSQLLPRFRSERFDVQYRPSKQHVEMTRIDWETQWKTEFRAWRRALETGNALDAFPKGTRRLDD